MFDHNVTTIGLAQRKRVGKLVDFNHETKVVRLTLLQLIVDQPLHQAWHLDQARHWALGRGPFLSTDRFDCYTQSHFTNSVVTKTQYPHMDQTKVHPSFKVCHEVHTLVQFQLPLQQTLLQTLKYRLLLASLTSREHEHH
jgi:hypothetical protein